MPSDKVPHGRRVSIWGRRGNFKENVELDPEPLGFVGKRSREGLIDRGDSRGKGME